MKNYIKVILFLLIASCSNTSIIESQMISEQLVIDDSKILNYNFKTDVLANKQQKFEDSGEIALNLFWYNGFSLLCQIADFNGLETSSKTKNSPIQESLLSVKEFKKKSQLSLKKDNLKKLYVKEDVEGLVQINYIKHEKSKNGFSKNDINLSYISALDESLKFINKISPFKKINYFYAFDIEEYDKHDISSSYAVNNEIILTPDLLICNSKVTKTKY